MSYVFNYFVITKDYIYSKAIRRSIRPSVSNVSRSLRFSCPAVVFKYCGDSRV